MNDQDAAEASYYPDRVLTIDDLHNIAGYYAPLRRGDAERIEMLIVMTLLRFFLGDAWCDNNIPPGIPEIDRDFRKSRAFLGPDTVAHADRFRLMRRMLKLAENLYNLQDAQGLDHVVEEIRRMHLKSRYEELMFAAAVRRSGAGVRFIRPSTVPGVKSPDFEILRAGEPVLSVEVEGKSEETHPTLVTLKRSLKHGREQLPSGGPGAIFVSIPQE